ncbi:MAG TPA: polysaccharide biosynthesis tyrosine autokinase [Anaerolineae bacterium]|nr:polysaccharide biosynthesis tyrosine autokinase [Anaerolineae bacterium]
MENELKKYGTILWHWAWLIVLGTVLGAGIAYASSRLTKDVYSASTTLLVNEAPSSGKTADYTSILTSERLARTYSEMMIKQPVKEEALKDLNIDPASTNTLPARISVNLVRDTQLMVLQVESEDKKLAMDLANAIPAAFSRKNAAVQTERYADSKANLTKEIDALKEQIASKQTEINAIGTPAGPSKESELARLQTELTQLRQSLTYLLQSYENIRLAEAQSTSNIVVVEPATLPDLPIRPRTTQNTLLGALVGLMLSIGVVFLIEYLDDRIRSPEQIDKVLKLPVVGLIAKMSNGYHGLGRQQLIAVREPRSPVVEAFRSLRTNIQFAGVDQPIRTLLVTSAGPSEGKSTIAANLAIVMAQAGLKVALVDGDLRRPALHKLFNQANRAGLTDVILRDPGQWSGLTIVSGVPNLSLLLSGALPPNPSELLGSKRMHQLLDYLHQFNDVIIVDAPPLLPVTDALVLAPLTDGVLMVIDYGSTRIGEALQGRAQLDQSGARLLGVVMNKIPTGRRGYSYYYRHYYTYEGDGNTKRRGLKGGEGRHSTGSGVSGASADSALEPSKGSSKS